jgi:hypothetical protein
MCIKKILDWFKPDPIIPVVGNKVALIFAIGSGYYGTQNDLDGPPKDFNNVTNFIKSKYPEFTIKKFLDLAVTRASFRDNIKAQILNMKSGDILLIYYSGHGTNGVDVNEPDRLREGLYFTDGTFWDDEFNEILQLTPEGGKVIVALDSCFAKGSTTTKGDIRNKSKFVQTQEIPVELKRKSKLAKADIMKWIVFAACAEDQTAADTNDGGAFTLFWLKAWFRDYDYLGWSIETAYMILENGNFDQIPNIEGDAILMKQKIFT